MHISKQDIELVKGCISNNRKSQEILYRKYFGIVRNMCYRYTQDEDTLLTIINDGFLKVFKNVHKYEQRGSFEGWIKRLVFNALSDYFKKANRKQKFLSLENAVHKDDESITDNLYLEDLNKIINTLSKSSREVFILYAIDGYTHKEIAAKLAIAEGTSKWHLSKAREVLKAIIKEKKLNIHYG